MSGYFTNQHGVRYCSYTSGSHYGERQKDGAFRTNVPIAVPRCCIQCNHFDHGEAGDCGEQLSPPSCGCGVFFPTRSGVCARQNLNGWWKPFAVGVRVEGPAFDERTRHLGWANRSGEIVGPARDGREWEVKFDGGGSATFFEDELSHPDDEPDQADPFANSAPDKPEGG